MGNAVSAGSWSGEGALVAVGAVGEGEASGEGPGEGGIEGVGDGDGEIDGEGDADREAVGAGDASARATAAPLATSVRQKRLNHCGTDLEGMRAYRPSADVY